MVKIVNKSVSEWEITGQLGQKDNFIKGMRIDLFRHTTFSVNSETYPILLIHILIYSPIL